MYSTIITARTGSGAGSNSDEPDVRPLIIFPRVLKMAAGRAECSSLFWKLHLIRHF
jgi:hypothetical protein